MLNRAFWVATLELVLVTFASTFTGSLTFTNGTPTWHGVVAAATAAGVASLYALVTQFKSVQAVKAVTVGKASTTVK